jgi:hypothetical protein
MTLKKQGNFAFSHASQQNDIYNVYSATEIKQHFDSRSQELKVTVNAIIDQLQSITDADSGADNIKMTAIAETGTADTVQAVIEALITKIKAVTDSSSGADLVGMTPISETGNANTVQAVIEALITELKDITDSSSGADLIGATAIKAGSGTKVQSILEWLYQEIIKVTLGQIPDGSLTDVKLSDDAGQIKDTVTSHLADTAIHTTQLEKDKLAGIETGAQVNDVTSVAGKTGAVSLVNGDVGLGNVDDVKQLPIAGGTLTGKLIIESTGDGILTLKQTDAGTVAGTKEGGWNYIQFMDGQNDRQGYFGIDPSGHFVFFPEVTGAVVKIGSNDVFHAGNTPQTRVSNGQLEYLDGGVWKPVAAIKSVQRGISTMALGSSTVNVTISSINTAKSKVETSETGYSHDGHSYVTAAVRSRLTSATNLELYGLSMNTGGAASQVAWEVIEYA